MKVTAATITDEQIRELRTDLHADGHTDTTYSDACDVALLDIMTFRGYERLAAQTERQLARARCAEIWNARHGAES